MMTIGIHAMLPAEVWNGLESSLMEMPKFRKEMTRLQWEQSHLSEYIAALSLAFLFLVGFVFVVRRLWAILYRTSSLVENAVPLVALAFLPPFFMEGTHYIYDFPAMAFFALGLLLMLQSRWVL